MAVKKEKNKKDPLRFKLVNISFIIAIFLPFLLSAKSTILGHIPFWYDPARDLLLAWDNLMKPTLIGPPTGIPGLFYGPYWIWLLSIGLAISKDPRLVVLLILTLPYFLLLPFLLFKLSLNLFDKVTVIILWLLFILSFMGYTNQIWNPHLAPLLYFAIVFMVVKTDFSTLNKKFFISILLLGVLQGLLLNFHISFGLGIFLATCLFFIIHLLTDFGRQREKGEVMIKWFVKFLVYGTGIVTIFLPTIFFETRHGFNQIKALLFTLNQAIVHQQAVVGQVGLNKQQIISVFFERSTSLLQLPQQFSLIVSVLIISWVGIDCWNKRSSLSKSQRHLLLFMTTSTVGILTVYLTSKNPVWGYHFIGVEVIFVFLLGFLIDQHQLLKNIMFVWVSLLLLINIFNGAKSFMTGPRYSGLSAEKVNVESIFTDASNRPFAYSAKNAAIYTYDYDYLFRWLGKKYAFIPQNEVKDSALVYLIIPPELLNDKVGFVENRTPEKTYKTTQEWTGNDGVLIIKREINKEQQ